MFHFVCRENEMKQQVSNTHIIIPILVISFLISIVLALSHIDDLSRFNCCFSIPSFGLITCNDIWLPIGQELKCACDMLLPN